MLLKRSLFVQFFGPQIVILLVSLGAMAFYAWHAGWVAHRDERVRAMYAQANLIARLALQPDGMPRPAAMMREILSCVFGRSTDVAVMR